MNQDQIRWLDRCTDRSWKINPDTGLVDVESSFSCAGQELIDFKGVRFGTIGGNFYCHFNQLTSLEGAPKEIGWYFSCRENQLTSLAGTPVKVGGAFDCSVNRLTSLAGAPVKVGGDFNCGVNQLTSLMTDLAGTSVEVGGDFYCYDNPVSEKTLETIYNLMKGGKRYPEALSQYWNEIPEEDKILMYMDNPNLSSDESRGYELRNRVKGITI
jgi:hypothetical protein